MFNPIETRTPYRRQERTTRPDLKLDANEGPCPALGYDGLTIDAEAARCYPQTDSVEAMLAARYGVAADRVLVTAGIDDAIDRLSRSLLGGGGELILPSPTFEMIRRHAERAGGCVRSVEWDGGAFPVDAVVASVTDRTAALAVVSPNNPTGAVISRGELERLRAAVPGLPLILDLAYVEFADENPTVWALNTPDVIILRTFSKAWGLAGARVGYVMADPATIESLRAWGQPYAVAGPSLALAASALTGGSGRLEMTVRRVRQERADLAALLKELGVRSRDSQANFVLARVPNAEFVGEALASLGIAIRTWPNDEELGDAVRIGCPGNAADFARLSMALRTVLAPEALLLDMDGVIADEGPSYREAILATLASYDVKLQRSDLAAAKAAAGANDDIDLTRDLLLRAGRAVASDDVVERFQGHYLGDGNTPGLCEQERLIPDRAVLERLAARMPLAIVTGRPRAEARAFLRRFDLAGLFTTLVAAEDAPSKPDPAPVQIALDRLGVSTAWMVGDTPADVTAARLAGVVALGVRPPDADDAPGDDAMLSAGAVRMLDNLSAIERILP
jgi:histidinol-phosphate aminotransferase